MTDPISISHGDAQRIFDLAVGADQACSGFMETDDVAAMRRLAVALGVDPKVCTGAEFEAKFPHQFKPGNPDLDQHREYVTERRSSMGAAIDVRRTRPETDDEVIARLGATPPQVCTVGRWMGRCGRSADDAIHAEDWHEVQQ